MKDSVHYPSNSMSVLRMSLGARLLWVVVLIVLLWMAAFWAMD